MSTVARRSDSATAARFDTVGIAVPVDDFDRFGCDVQVTAMGTERETFKYSRKLPGGGFMATGVAHKAWIEASLPKRASDEDDNSEALELAPALEVLHGMYCEALAWIDVPSGHAFDESKVIRLDLVRDFHDVGADRQTELLNGLAMIDQPGRAKVRRFADPSANRAETLRVGPKAWGCTLYDKHTETRGVAPAGQVRFEARLHKAQLSSVFARHNGGHFVQVADLVRARLDGEGDGGGSIATAQRAWFDRVGFDRAIPAQSELVRLLATSGLSNRNVAMLWAYLTLPGFIASLNRSQVYKLRAMADTLEVCPVFEGAGTAIDPTAGQTIRLDYEAGTLVAAAA